jgi:hypothetical protein
MPSNERDGMSMKAILRTKFLSHGTTKHDDLHMPSTVRLINPHKNNSDFSLWKFTKKWTSSGNKAKWQHFPTTEQIVFQYVKIPQTNLGPWILWIWRVLTRKNGWILFKAGHIRSAKHHTAPESCYFGGFSDDWNVFRQFDVLFYFKNHFSSENGII